MSAGQGQNDDKNSMAILWIIGSVFLIAAVIWWSFAPQIKYCFIKLRVAELYAAYWCLKLLPFPQTYAHIKNAVILAHSVTPSTLTLGMAEYLSILMGEVYRWPLSVGLIFFAYLMYGRNIKMKYKKHYDMHKLAEQEKSEWPQINPVLGLNLSQVDLDDGVWAMGMTPIMFCKYYKMLEIKLLPPAIGVVNKAPRFKAQVNQAKAEQVFTRQLGRMWRGPEKLPLHRRALFAAFIARGMRDTKAAQQLIWQINNSATADHSKELDFTGADELWQKYYPSKMVQKLVQAHAYEFTLLIGALLFARQDGVFATSDFLWLKPRDRSCWYVLNSVGRQTPCCEAAGVFAHFLAEKSLGRALTVPMINEAVKALQLALNDVLYVPTEEEQELLLAQVAKVTGE